VAFECGEDRLRQGGEPVSIAFGFPDQKSAKLALDGVAADWQRAVSRAGGLK
jgi:hypothetical protein